jgi:hypothetical protein
VRFLPLLALALAACSPGARSCDLTVERDLVFTSAEAEEGVTARAFGASCDKAVGVYVVHDGESRPIWSWSVPLEHAFGDVFAAGDTEAMVAFLERWATPDLASTKAAPDYALLAPGQTDLDRATYEDLRARDVPMLCHFSGAERQTCIFWEAAAGAAGHFYDRDAPAAAPPTAAQ